LFAACPDVPRRVQPGRIVERAGPDPLDPMPRHAANPGAALWANQSDVHTPAVGGPLERSRLNPTETKGGICHDDPYREGTAPQTLAVSAVARVDQPWSFGDLRGRNLKPGI
jgi:hypothetical protein